MVSRRGLGKGQGKGYKNITPPDPMVHSMSARGIRQKRSFLGRHLFSKQSFLKIRNIKTGKLLEFQTMKPVPLEEGNTFTLQEWEQKYPKNIWLGEEVGRYVPAKYIVEKKRPKNNFSNREVLYVKNNEYYSSKPE